MPLITQTKIRKQLEMCIENMIFPMPIKATCGDALREVLPERLDVTVVFQYSNVVINLAEYSEDTKLCEIIVLQSDDNALVSLEQVFQHGKIFDKQTAPRSSYLAKSFLIKHSPEFDQFPFYSECTQSSSSFSSFDDTCNEILHIDSKAIKPCCLKRFFTLCLENYKNEVNKSGLFNEKELTIKNLEKTAEVLEHLIAIEVWGWCDEFKKMAYIVQLELTFYYLCKISKKLEDNSLCEKYTKQYREHCSKYSKFLVLRTDVMPRVREIRRLDRHNKQLKCEQEIQVLDNPNKPPKCEQEIQKSVHNKSSNENGGSRKCILL
jgi:hypothetical protein